jgi:translation initiation factor IF-3
MQTQQNFYRPRINHQIRIPQVRVILSDGSQAGIMETRDALKMAQEQGLDLIEINPRATPPVVRIADFGKLKYEEKKKQSAAKKNQKTVELKEIAFRPATEEHDLNHKIEAAKEFLTEGNKVKFVVKFRGRELTHTDIGKEKLEWVLQQLSELSTNFTSITMEGKNMSTVVSPGHPKTEK